MNEWKRKKRAYVAYLAELIRNQKAGMLMIEDDDDNLTIRQEIFLVETQIRMIDIELDGFTFSEKVTKDKDFKT